MSKEGHGDHKEAAVRKCFPCGKEGTVEFLVYRLDGTVHPDRTGHACETCAPGVLFFYETDSEKNGDYGIGPVYTDGLGFECLCIDAAKFLAAGKMPPAQVTVFNELGLVEKVITSSSMPLDETEDEPH